MHRKTIVIIEDDYDLAEVLTDILNLEGYDCAIWSSAQPLHALNHPIDLILCDMRLAHNTNGTRVLRQFRNDPLTRRIPFVMMSGVTDMVAIQRTMHQGANYYLPKPFRIEHLLRVVTALTEPVVVNH